MGGRKREREKERERGREGRRKGGRKSFGGWVVHIEASRKRSDQKEAFGEERRGEGKRVIYIKGPQRTQSK